MFETEYKLFKHDKNNPFWELSKNSDSNPEIHFYIDCILSPMRPDGTMFHKKKCGESCQCFHLRKKEIGYDVKLDCIDVLLTDLTTEITK